MPLYLSESVVDRLVTARPLTDALEAALQGAFEQAPRRRVRSGRDVLHSLPAISPHLGRAAIKTYLTGSQGVRFVTLLFDLEHSSLRAVIESGRLGQLRTGSATALVTRYRRPPAPWRVALIGTGTVARGQLEALAAEGQAMDVRVYGRDAERRAAFVAWAQARNLPAQGVDSAEEAVQGANLVVTATTAVQPVVEAAWLGESGLLCPVGSNWSHKAEVDADCVRRCREWIVDDPAQAALEAGDLLRTEGFSMAALQPLQTVVRAGAQTIESGWVLFKSLGIAIEDLAAAELAVRLAEQAGLGQPLTS